MIGEDDLAELERSVETALRTGDVSGLRLLGQGEISLVLGAGAGADPEPAPVWACKRLPPFATVTAADRYAATIDRYIAELTRRGVAVLDTSVRRVPAAHGGVVLYCVQPVLPTTELAVTIARHDAAAAAGLIAEIVETAWRVIDTTVGLDAQLSNWAVVDGRLTYFDITTPMLRDADGVSELDTEIFLASLPWALRSPVRRFVLPGILDRYHDPRTAALDLASNLLKEQLAELIPAALKATAGRFRPALSEREVAADRRSDARTWAALQAVRRVDRTWQRRVRQRPYPFLLPTHTDG
jgi:hypothetical protein